MDALDTLQAETCDAVRRGERAFTIFEQIHGMCYNVPREPLEIENAVVFLEHTAPQHVQNTANFIRPGDLRQCIRAKLVVVGLKTQPPKRFAMSLAALSQGLLDVARNKVYAAIGNTHIQLPLTDGVPVVPSPGDVDVGILCLRLDVRFEGGPDKLVVLPQHTEQSTLALADVTDNCINQYCVLCTKYLSVTDTHQRHTPYIPWRRQDRPKPPGHIPLYRKGCARSHPPA